MVERKSTSTCNQETKNCETYSQFFETMSETDNGQEKKDYSRDFMLQLRLHPLSLQKPQNLPDVEVIKEKLYLHHINDSSCASTNKHTEMNLPLSRSDYCNMKHEYPVVPSYFNKMHPYCVASQMYNGTYQNASSKLRTPYHTYCNPLQRHSFASHSCYKDYTIDKTLWTKKSYTSCEDMWPYSSDYPHSSFTVKKNDVEVVPKNRKKLSIIDPVTGKNILEAVTKTSEEESNTCHIDEIFKSSDESNTEMNGNGYTSDNFSNGTSDDGSVPIVNECYGTNIPCSSENKLQYNSMKDDNGIYPNDFLKGRTPENQSKLKETSDEREIPLPAAAKEENHSYSKDSMLISDSSATQGNVYACTPSESVHDCSDTHKLFNKQTARVSPNIEINHPVDVHIDCQAQCPKEKKYNQQVCKDCAFMQADAMKEGLCQVHEKIYVLRQEQQKLAILQSFLRYKKYQLEENMRNLDEKRIDIANLECNLHNKAKRLQDKEQWLENKSEMLQQKAQEIEQRERIINERENRITCELQTLNNVSKEASFSSKKLSFDNCSDIVWKGINNKAESNSRKEETGDNEFTDFECCTNSCRITETSTNAEKCRLDTSAMDELEKNIVMMEKLHSSNEVGDSHVEIKSEPISSLAAQKKNENAVENIGYSKGRRYLPEHIKYWLDKEDKSSV